MATVQDAVAMATRYFAALDDASQEIYFTCTPYTMWRTIEILPGSWVGTLSLFSVIEVRKRPYIRAVGEQAAVSGPMQQPAPAPAAAFGVGWWTSQVDAMLIILSNLVHLAILVTLIISAIVAIGVIFGIVCWLIVG